MKISASIYSDKSRNLTEVIAELSLLDVDFFHVDCNDDPLVFQDIQLIRKLSNKPIDLHIITNQPSKYYDLLTLNPVDYLTFQYENSEERPIQIPTSIKGKKGLAITTQTPIEVFKDYTDFDFILVMATTPGASGGRFDAINFRKIRQFGQAFPDKPIHVDGGVDAEVSFILRNMGVVCSVSGSYLFKQNSVSEAISNLKARQTQSKYLLRDFMSTDFTAVLKQDQLSLKNVLLSIENGKLGFSMITDNENNLVGLISNADVRRGLIDILPNLNELDVHQLINRQPITIYDDNNVYEMFDLIRSYAMPISYLPVITRSRQLVGYLTFVNLIKGEL